MINQHQSIELFGVPLFTWIDMTTPMEGIVPIPAEACFTYFLRADNQILSKQHSVSARSEHAILSACGISLGKMLMEQEEGRINSFIVHFQPEILKTIYNNEKPPHWKEIDAPITKPVIQMAASNLIKLFISGLQGLFENKEAVTEDILILKLKEIILLLMMTDDHPEVTHIIRALFSERSFSFKEIVEAYIFTPATIENLATLTHTSKSTFKREFTKIYKNSPQRYIINRRIDKVADLLKVSDASISAIGYDCGFSSPTHLTRVFKAKFNKTPSEYRLDFSDK